MNIDTLVVGPLEANCYIVSRNGMAFVVDPGADAYEIKQHLVADSLKLDFIIFTHGHADHIGAALEFHAPMYILAGEEKMLADPRLNMSYFSGHEVQIDPLSVFTVKHGDEIDFEGDKLKIIHTPGHTAHGMSILYDGVVFSGDSLFKGSVGRSDLPTGNEASLINAIRGRLFSLPDKTLVYPGHGMSTTIGHEKLNNPFFI